MELEQALDRQVSRRTAVRVGIGFLLGLVSGVSWRDTSSLKRYFQEA